LFNPSPTPFARESTLVGCPQRLIQYSRSYPPYLEAIFSIRNPKTCHDLMRETPCYQTIKRTNTSSDIEQ